METEQPCLSVREAFDAMVRFLTSYYDRTKYDQLGLLLGELEIFESNRTTDPAAWFDWVESVEAVTAKHED